MLSPLSFMPFFPHVKWHPKNEMQVVLSGTRTTSTFDWVHVEAVAYRDAYSLNL